MYECRVMHYRKAPKEHKLTTNVFMFYLDLDEIDQLDQQNWLFGRNRRRIFEFRDKDHLDFGAQDTKANVLKYIQSKGIQTKIARMMLLTNCRTLGYQFNPVSFYFCFDENNQPVCAVPEIGNTFGELKPYFIGPENLESKGFASIQEKYFYISPFVGLDIPMDFQLAIPDERLNIRVDDWNKERTEKFLITTLTGKKRVLSSKNLLFYGLKFPWITLKVIFLIHWHAAILHFVKKVPHHKKSANQDLQREVQRVYKA